MNLHRDTMKKMVEGARHFAAADRSDPFTHTRALAHIRSGVAGWKKNEDHSEEPAWYSASPVMDEEGRVTWRNAQRP